jgi:hypothetical protein
MMVPFIGESYTHRSPDVSPQETINLYPEVLRNDQAKSRYILIGTPGTDTFLDLEGFSGTGACRGLYTTSTGRVFGVWGSLLVEVLSNGGGNLIGNVGIGASRINFTDNGYYLVLVDGKVMRLLDLDTGSFFQQPLPFDNPSDVVYLNSRIVAINKSANKETGDGENPENNKFYWSGVGPSGPTSWSGIDWASAESNADPIIAVTVTRGRLWLFGPRSYEVWQTTTSSKRPYVIVGGSSSEIGCESEKSVTTISEQVFWLGSSTVGNNRVFVNNSYNAAPISTPAIEYELDKGSNEGAIGFAYQQEGHTFYVLTLPDINKTYVYDLSTGQWHRRSTRESATNKQNFWAPQYSTLGFGEILVGDGVEPRLFTLSLDKYDEWDNRPIVRLRRSSVYWDDLRTVYYNEAILDMETGVGLQTGQGSDPRAMMRFSDDGGHTFGNEMWAPIGKIGQYKNRVVWPQLGSSRERVIEISCSDPIKQVWLGLRINSTKSGAR